MKKNRRTLTTLLLISVLLIAAIGGYLKYGLLRPLGIQREESVMALPFVMLADDGLRFMVEMNAQALDAPTEPTVPPTEQASQLIETEPSTEPATEPATEPPATTEPEPTKPEYIQLDESWFDDALFIGDSRTMGLRNYHRLGEAEYFTTIGMNVYNVFIVSSSDTNFEKMSLESLLQKHTYGKILIGIGINECDYPYDYIMEGFQRLIDMIKQYQPDAVIILQAIMTVSEKQTQVAECFSLENLGKINEGIASFADGERIFYIDVNEWIADENGYLPEEVTFDGIHLYGAGYKDWALWFVDACGYLGIP